MVFRGTHLILTKLARYSQRTNRLEDVRNIVEFVGISIPNLSSVQGLSWQRTYYTSRGYAWYAPLFSSPPGCALTQIARRIGVNYGGSSGYGRKYM